MVGGRGLGRVGGSRRGRSRCRGAIAGGWKGRTGAGGGVETRPPGGGRRVPRVVKAPAGEEVAVVDDQGVDLGVGGSAARNVATMRPVVTSRGGEGGDWFPPPTFMNLPPT